MNCHNGSFSSISETDDVAFGGGGVGGVNDGAAADGFHSPADGFILVGAVCLLFFSSSTLSCVMLSCRLIIEATNYLLQDRHYRITTNRKSN